MKKKECWIELNKKEFEKQEELIRRFLLKNSSILRLTRITWCPALFGFITLIGKKGSKKAFGTDTDPKFIKFNERLESDFIKRIVNNKKYNDLKQPLNQKYEHYFYKLSRKLRDLINKETLFFTNINNYYDTENFYGFEDPTFYKNKEMIGYVISHELQVGLYLTEKERHNFENKGIKFFN